jgi:hypothetical protein
VPIIDLPNDELTAVVMALCGVLRQISAFALAGPAARGAGLGAIVLHNRSGQRADRPHRPPRVKTKS